MEGQVITVPTGIEAPTLLTEIVVGLKLVPSAATPGKASPKHKKRLSQIVFCGSLLLFKVAVIR